MPSITTIQAVKNSLSLPRIGTYEAALDSAGNPITSRQALHLYAWNAQVSAALMAPLHICEVVVRNAVSDALEAVYGQNWPRSVGFEQSLPAPHSGYSQLKDVRAACRAHNTTGKVIPELKFVFWQKMFTARYDNRLWAPHMARIFPGLPQGPNSPRAIGQYRLAVYNELDHIRTLRNRIAHHEPIFARNLADDFRRISELIALRCPITADWMNQNQQVALLIAARPV